MKRYILLLSFILICANTAQAHYLWVETESRGAIGTEHAVRVHYGEYTYGVVEAVDGESFPLVADFSLWLLAPDGSRTQLETNASKDFYSARFVPKMPGTYTLMLANNEVDVLDYAQYDFGIFKPHYHATAMVQVGGEAKATEAENPEGLSLQRLVSEEGEVRLKLNFRDAPLEGAEVKVFVADLWSKALETDANGEISFSLPWNTKYIVEATYKEEAPGTFKGKEYDFIWHCATYCIKN